MGLDILYVVGDARYLPFRDTIFDQVFSYSVLQHLAKSDVERVLDDVARVLKTGESSLIQMAASGAEAQEFRSFQGNVREAGSNRD
jgi:ubiquinone/menaquinone biosynthesis C-methylase UbiE